MDKKKRFFHGEKKFEKNVRVKKNIFYTPNIKFSGIEGIMRGVILKLLKKLLKKLVEK